MSKIKGNNIEIENALSINGIPINLLGGGGSGETRNYLVYELKFPNNKSYIGITKDFKQRMRQHKYCSTRKKSKVYSAIKKYGWDNIDKNILKENLSSKEAENFEIHYINIYNSLNKGYNLASGGKLGKHSKESINKIKKYQSSPEVIVKKSIRSKEFMKCPDRRKNASEYLTNYNKSEKHSELMVNRWKEDKDYSKKMSKLTKSRSKQLIHLSKTQEALDKWRETRQNKINLGISNIGNKPYKKVICLENTIIYKSAKECAKKLNICEKGIRRSASGERSSYKNMNFRYIVNDVRVEPWK